MIKQTLLKLSVCVGATFIGGGADAFFGHGWHQRHHRAAGCGGAYYSPATYRARYSPYAYQANYARATRPFPVSSYGYGNYGYSPYGRGLSRGYGYGYRSGYRPLTSGYGATGMRSPYSRSGYRGYPYSSYRFGGNAGLMGLGNGYYYGGFPTTRARGIGVGPQFGFGW